MTTKILTPMETSLLDTVNRMHSDHQKERSHLIQQIADLRKEVVALRSMMDDLARQQAWQTKILTALQPLLGLSFSRKD